ncbi:hypothetical protein [Falsibacillus pallidus]|uniref:hypothetical protein n=1 Tax=Falsibacillus pallidus TaxID=493781 RepID=UPI003D99D6C6
MKRNLLFAIISAVLLFSAGCSSSIKDQSKDAESSVKKAFEAEPKEADEKLKELKVHLPFGMSVKKETANNVILKKGSNIYILFYNTKESEDSDLVYKMSIGQGEAPYLTKTYKDDGRFGYLIINKVKKDLYEVSTGIGGIKMTTEVKTRKVASTAEMMMETVSSAEYRNKK